MVLNRLSNSIDTVHILAADLRIDSYFIKDVGDRYNSPNFLKKLDIRHAYMDCHLSKDNSDSGTFLPIYNFWYRKSLRGTWVTPYRSCTNYGDIPLYNTNEDTQADIYFIVY